MYLRADASSGDFEFSLYPDPAKPFVVRPAYQGPFFSGMLFNIEDIARRSFQHGDQRVGWNHRENHQNDSSCFDEATGNWHCGAGKWRDAGNSRPYAGPHASRADEQVVRYYCSADHGEYPDQCFTQIREVGHLDPEHCATAQRDSRRTFQVCGLERHGSLRTLVPLEFCAGLPLELPWDLTCSFPEWYTNELYQFT
jgi:hypothetical protein